MRFPLRSPIDVRAVDPPQKSEALAIQTAEYAESRGGNQETLCVFSAFSATSAVKPLGPKTCVFC